MSEVIEMSRNAAWNTMSETDAERTVEMVNRMRPLLPDPTGYRLLIAVPLIRDTTAGGIAKPNDMMERERTGTVIAYVVGVGPDAYSDKTKFPTGPWCKPGDWVLFRNYSGTRFMIGGFEFRFIHDDAVDGVTSEPSGITRVG